MAADFNGVSPNAMAAWKRLNLAWGKPLSGNSAYRDPVKNAAVGGARKSQHMHGNAFDVNVADFSQEDRIALIKKARESKFGGVGVYNNALHFDVGPQRAWGPNFHKETIPAWAQAAVSYVPQPGVSNTPAGNAVTDLAGGQSMPMADAAPRPPLPIPGASPQVAQQAQQVPPMADRKIFGLSTTPPDPNSRAAAIAKAIGAYGTGLAAGNPAAGLQGASDVAGEWQQRQSFGQQLDGMDLTPQQRGFLDTMGPKAAAPLLAQKLFPAAAEVPASYREFQLAKNDGFAGSFAEWAKGKDDQSLINAGGGNLYDPATKQWITSPAASESPTEAGLTPTYWEDKDGNLRAGQLLKGGGVKEIPLPEGGAWLPGVGYLDTGTGFVPYDKRGGIDPAVAPIPKDVAGESAAKEQGKIEGTAQGQLPAAAITANQTVAKIDELLADPNLAKVSGVESYLPDWALATWKGGSTLGVRRRVEQLKGSAFLEAYNGLRGGGQITEVEGKKAEDAMARLETAQTDADYVQALKDFREAVVTGYQKLAANAGQISPPPAPGGAISPRNPAPAGNLKSKYGLE